MCNYDRVGRFRMVSGDVNPLDYGATWGWQVPGTRRFHFARLLNWEDTAGKREAADLPTYNISLSEVDLESVSADQIRRATEGVDLGDEPHWIPGTPASSHMWGVACCLHDYGSSAPLLDESGNNWRTLFRAAAARSLEVAADARALDRGTCNQIGSTPREMMRGDIASALGRGLRGGNPTADIIARMYKAANYQTLGGDVAENVRDVVESHKETT